MKLQIKYLKYIGGKEGFPFSEWFKEAEPYGRVLVYVEEKDTWYETRFNSIAYCHYTLGADNYRRTDKQEFDKWRLAWKLIK